MNKEKRLIELIARVMPKSGLQLNRLYESDAEVIRYQNTTFLLTVDEFSEEDMFRDDEPYTLGWNLAVGGISDIEATGGKPLFYAHSLVVARRWKESYIKLVSRGIADVLRRTGTFFIGGDFGTGEGWRYTAVVIGTPINKPLLRTGAGKGDIIYLSGKIGAGNLEALLKIYSGKKVFTKTFPPAKNHFRIRTREAVLISKYATAGIDTSDGVFNAVNTLTEMSSKGYFLTSLPYLPAGLAMARAFLLPPDFLFLGECGEYELLFTIKKRDKGKFLGQAKEKGLRFFEIGEVTEPGIRTLQEKDRKIDLNEFGARARDYKEIKGYLKAMKYFLERVKT